jgi:BASS family bile acid:Na+ symporter
MQSTFFSNHLMPIAIAAIMLGVGMNLKFRDFQHIFRKPKAVITGLVAQMILLPVIAFLFNSFWDLSPIVKVGFILIAVCPGGTTSNIVTLFLRGQLALSVTLTAFNSVLILFTIPVIMHFALKFYLGAEQEIHLPVLTTIRDIMLSVILPVIAGMTIKYYLPKQASFMRKPMTWIMTGFLLFVFGGIILIEKNGNAEVNSYLPLFLPAFVLNAITMFAGYLLALATGINNRGRFTIAIQVGLQNSALAIFIASKMLGQNEMAMVAVIYGSFTLFSTYGWAWVMKKYL